MSPQKHRLTKLLIVLALTVAASGYSLGQYKYPLDNFMITLRNPLDVSPIIGKHFEGDYHNNGAICPNPYLAIQIIKARLRGVTSLNLNRGTYQTNLNAALLGEAREDKCRLGAFDFACSKSYDLVGPVGEETELKIPCVVNWRNTGLGGNIEQKQKFKTPIATPAPVIIQLPTPSGGEVDISFAKKVQGEWVPLDAPQDKKIQIDVEGAAYFFPRLMDYNAKDPQNFQTQGDSLLAISAFRNGTVDTTSMADAITQTLYNPYYFFDTPNSFASIRIREGLFANPDFPVSANRGYGLLGAWFPLLIHGKTKIMLGGSEQDVTLKLAIDAAKARIASANSVPSITISLRIASVTIKIDKTQQELLTDPIQPFVELAGPIVMAGGKLHFESVVVGLDLAGTSNGDHFELPLGKVLADMINKSLPDLSTLSSKFVSETPDCIEVERGEARRDCKDFSGRTSDLFALNLQDGVVRNTIEIDWGATEITARPGVVIVNIFKK